MDEGSIIEVAYHFQDFRWEDLRDEVESSSALDRIEDSSADTTQEPFQKAAWDDFHTRHSEGLFFKERRYLVKEFPELKSWERPFIVLEVGCGTGSSVVPILRANQNAIVYGCDLSETALKIATTSACKALNLSVGTNRFHSFICDVSVERLPTWLCCMSCRERKEQVNNLFQFEDCSTSSMPCMSSPCCAGGVDFVTMIFTLSAIPLDGMVHAISECFTALKPGGYIFFRDYGLYDMTMLRFAPSQRIAAGLYQREDGTLSYYFTCETVRDLFTRAGFVEDDIQYCCVELKNRKKNLPMKRVWIHAKFRKV